MPAWTRESAVLTALLLVGCSQPTQTSSERSEVAEQPADPALQARCQSAVHHITTLIVAGFGGAAPAEQEAALIKATEQVSIANCVHEGLTEAQARCILDTPDALGMGKLGECPAIREKQPSWLRLPPPGAFERALERRSGGAATTAEDGGGVRDGSGEVPGASTTQPQLDGP